MDVMEVVSPHIFLPVLGVVFCAVLVFAFGFKSPVQPPSFDFEDEKRQRDKKAKKNKGKSSVNGHVAVGVTDESSAKTASPNKSVVKQSPGKAGKEKIPETKSPKSEKNEKKQVKKPVIKDEPKVEENDLQEADVDGWVMQKSRKVKKQKGKSDEKPDVAVAPPEDKTSSSDEKSDKPAPEAIIKTETEVSPKQQRSKKKKSEKTEKTGEDVPKSPETKQTEKAESKPPEKPSEPKRVEKTAEKKGSDKPVENKRSKKQAEAKPVEPPPEQKVEKAVEPVAEEFIDVSPKKKSKSKKENKKNTAESPTADIPKVDDPVPEVKVIPQAQTPEEPKAAKSPKKSKKSKEVAYSKAEKAPLDDSKGPSPEEINSLDKKSDEDTPEKTTSEKTSNAQGDALSSSAAAAEAKVEVTAAGDSSSAGQKPPVTFDEMGGASESWEAVPKSKKKRARREN